MTQNTFSDVLLSNPVD